MIFEALKAIILGIVEGFTEFLPISSTGHLILANQIISFKEKFTIIFDIVIQFGAILAVVIYFRKKLWPFKKNHKETLNIWYKTIVGVLPAIVLGFLLHDFMQEKLFNPFVVVGSLIIGGIVLILIERKKREGKINSIADLSFKTACFIGLIQCMAMVPGVSRSAATIIGAMLLGASRLVATEFSFFLAIPTIFLASVYTLFNAGFSMSLTDMIILAIGFITSFLVALGVIKYFMEYIKKHDFKVFGYYRIILGVIILLIFLI
jgi:undecaprenyl-diphosphatase